MTSVACSDSQAVVEGGGRDQAIYDRYLNASGSASLSQVTPQNADPIIDGKNSGAKPIKEVFPNPLLQVIPVFAWGELVNAFFWISPQTRTLV